MVRTMTETLPQEECTQIDTSECCGKPEIAHNCNVEFTSSTVIEGVEYKAKKTGYGTGASQDEACAAALEHAKEQAAELLYYKTLIQNFITGFGDDNYRHVAPLATLDVERSWQGRSPKKGWKYQITAVIPHLETIEPLWIAVQLLRRQTVCPYIIVVDTGSTRRTKELLERMRAEDLEIHYIMSNGYRSSSGPVPVAMDLAHSLCQTDYLFHTHSDVFLRRDDFLQDLFCMCCKARPVVGYRMSDRGWITNEWSYMVGHTATMLYLPEIEKTGATWSMERIYREDPILRARAENVNGWPDTETGFNRTLAANGINPIFIGDDLNFVRFIDKNIDHVRSYPGAQLYSKPYWDGAQAWMLDAIKQALKRLGVVNDR